MSHAYHVTERFHLNSILTQGLQPRIPAEGGLKAVALYATKEAALAAIVKPNRIKWRSQILALIKVDTTGLVVGEDVGVVDEIFISDDCTICPKRLEVVMIRQQIPGPGQRTSNKALRLEAFI